MSSNADWPTVIATLASALIGGALALAGSIWTTRRELIRGTRVRLFDELLPEVMGLWSARVGHPSRDPGLVEAVRRMTRAGIIAGRRDRKRTSRIDVLVGERGELVVMARGRTMAWADEYGTVIEMPYGKSTLSPKQLWLNSMRISAGRSGRSGVWAQALALGSASRQ